MSNAVCETGRAITAFAAYCALGSSRSLVKLTQELGKPSGYTRHLEAWSSKFHWVERATAYDREQADAKLRQQEAAIQDMDERHAQLGMEQQELAVKQITALIEAKSFGSLASVQLLKFATDLERLARGLPTERTEQHLSTTGMIAIYLPQKQLIESASRGGDSSVSSTDS
jgi:hypothetical protein